MKILLVTALLLFTAALPAGAQANPPNSGGGENVNQPNCGMLYGKDHFLTFCAPKGWTLNNSILNKQGIYAVFYPKGSSWQKAKASGTFMYINVIMRPAKATVAKMMAADASQTKKNAPAAVVDPGKPIKIGHRSVPVQRFEPGGFHRYEAVAYIGQKKVLVMFVTSSKNEPDFKRDYPAFVRLVRSYHFLGSNVTIEHK